MDPRLTYIQTVSREEPDRTENGTHGGGRSAPAARRREQFVDPITIRHSSAADELALRELAELDGRPAPSGPVLLAEIDGRLAAAVAVENGAAVADPFQRTASLVELLQAQAKRERAALPARRTFRSRLAARASRPSEARAA
jgi:hypothetical protein